MKIDDKLTRRDGESNLQYHKRIVFGKLVDKTLSDYDYPELALVLYGQQYSSDVARRMFYGERKLLEVIDEQAACNISDSDILSDISEKVAELQKERQKYLDQRRELNKIYNIDGRREHLYATLQSAAEDIAATCCRMYNHSYANTEMKKAVKCNEAVLFFSDWHYGMVVNNFFNDYDTEICKERVRTVTEEAVKRIMLHGSKKLHVVVLGDLIHGAIHTSARVASEELVCDQIMQVSEILAQSIEYLSQFVDETVVYVTYGNHSRVIQNKSDSIHADNLETIVPWWLVQRLSRYDDISVASSEDEFVFVDTIGNHCICAVHGDLDTPRSSVRTLPYLFKKKYGVDIEYIVLGDKHHRESFSELGVTSVICGSLCGTDDYANDNRLYSTPEQLLLIVDDNGVDAEYHIKV